MVHQFDPHMAPDSDFEPGQLEHLRAGNRGRMLDPRRTPISIVGLDVPAGHFILRIDAFEDEGALWEIPLESVAHYQFALGSARAPECDVETYRSAIQRFQQPLVIPCDSARARATALDVERRTSEARSWLRRGSTFLASGAPLDLAAMRGPSSLAEDLYQFMNESGVADIEEDFARRWASNPHSGELVKGHRIVLAELGLVPFEGSIVRRPTLFDGPWARQRRAVHIISRLAFVRALFAELGQGSVVLYRGLCCDGPPAPPRNDSFVSASFSFDVARSCTGELDKARVGVLLRQSVAVERVFMTYLETAALNDPFAEAEAVLLWQQGNQIF